jgi:hypothetical protein
MPVKLTILSLLAFLVGHAAFAQSSGDTIIITPKPQPHAIVVDSVEILLRFEVNERGIAGPIHVDSVKCNSCSAKQRRKFIRSALRIGKQATNKSWDNRDENSKPIAATMFLPVKFYLEEETDLGSPN